MATKSAVFRLAPLIRTKLSVAHAEPFDQIVEIIGEDGQASLAHVLNALFPGQHAETALNLFGQFRRAVASAAGDVGVRLSIEIDSQTRNPPTDRVVWFEAEDRVVQEVTRLVDAEIGNPARSTQFAQEDRPIRFFVSYAHDDAPLQNILVTKLRTLFRTNPRTSSELWTDHQIPLGEKWREAIQSAIDTCDFGLLLVSPAFLASTFIMKEELPRLLQNKPVIPVALKPILFDGSMDLKGLEERQIFFDGKRRDFSKRITDRTRDEFVLELYQKIRFNPEQSRPPKRRKYEHHLRSVVGDWNEKRWVPTEGVESTLRKGLDATPEIDVSRRKDAIEFLMEWIEDEKGPPYCALLGEYGMGKTTTCKALARTMLDLRDNGKPAQLPIYLDLRHIGERAKRDLSLNQILEIILERSWRGGPDETDLTAAELIRLVENDGALVIWDGLDEVLVHLDTNLGQMFTRQLFRILPLARGGQRGRGRMLISCRTHYFRTLRDQQNHFRAEDRDNIRGQDYRAPFVLLPFTTDQIGNILNILFSTKIRTACWQY